VGLQVVGVGFGRTGTSSLQRPSSGATTSSWRSAASAITCTYAAPMIAIQAQRRQPLAPASDGAPRAAVTSGGTDHEIARALAEDAGLLLLDLRDVYWSREGLLSVQLSLGGLVLLSGTILALRMLRRGERRGEEAGLIPDAAGGLALR